MKKEIITFSIAVDVKKPEDSDYTVAVSQAKERIEDAVKRECAATEGIEYCGENFYEPDELNRCEDCSGLVITNYQDFSTPGVDWGTELDGRLLCDGCYWCRKPLRGAVSLETFFEDISEDVCVEWDEVQWGRKVRYLCRRAGFKGRLDPEVLPVSR
jgi:hypothetical protein